MLTGLVQLLAERHRRSRVPWLRLRQPDRRVLRRDHPARAIAGEHRSWLLAEVSELLTALGVPRPDIVAEQLVMLRAGAMAVSSVRGSDQITAAFASSVECTDRADLERLDRGGDVAEGAHELFVEAADGRPLEVVVSGPDDGPVVVFHTGTPSAALHHPPTTRAAAENGLRLVSFGRPGYGASTAHPGRSVADVVPDTAAVLDQLGVDEFVALGCSGGGPHALACAVLLPDGVPGRLPPSPASRRSTPTGWTAWPAWARRASRSSGLTLRGAGRADPVPRGGGRDLPRHRSGATSPRRWADWCPRSTSRR